MKLGLFQKARSIWLPWFLASFKIQGFGWVVKALMMFLISHTQTHTDTLLCFIYLCLSSPKNIFSLILERGKHQCERKAWIGWLPYAPELKIVCVRIRDQTHNLRMCSNQESNLQCFGYGTMPQPTEPYWPGHTFLYFRRSYKVVFLLLDFSIVMTRVQKPR